MYFIVLLLLLEPAAQPLPLDRSSYSRRAQKKSTAEANYFPWFSAPSREDFSFDPPPGSE
jgi:hypothetical protein